MNTRATAAAFAAVTALALTGCGPGEITTKPDAAPIGSAPATSAPASAAPSTPPASQAATIGDTVTLKGNNDGEQLAVTIKQWADPAKSADQYTKPEDGKRWVAAQFELVNTGTAVYSDSPSNGTQVADDQGQQFQTTFGEVTAGPAMTSSAKVAPGAKVLGWIVYEVPQDSKITTVQFTMNSGFASQTGQWTIK
ncbi:DUF4352 domain-containing protein [Streptomyces sp. NBC_01233]|uniref:DUF4352 domain-containing protein n=1 Tax=Streptomyces sp. NBC_01233 TaxID=2903787 RepID=UPI002E138550|nr:DUF4352 domain-containing protein [Streptomyces sp. NBC_01233]